MATDVAWKVDHHEYDQLSSFDQAALRVWIEAITGRSFDDLVISEARIEGDEVVVALWPHYRLPGGRITVTSVHPVDERFPLSTPPPPLSR